MDLGTLAQACGNEDVSFKLKDAKPGMLVGLEWAENRGDDTEMELYDTTQPRTRAVNVVGMVGPRELGIIIHVVQDDLLVVFGERMGWISSRWLKAYT